MTNADAHLPDDIAREKEISRRLINDYRSVLFGGLRRLRALRQQAPGIVAEFVLSVIISVFAVVFFFRDLQVTEPLQTIFTCIKIIFVIGVSFWIAGRLWRLIGLANRDRVRFVVSNLWYPTIGGFLVLSFVLKTVVR